MSSRESSVSPPVEPARGAIAPLDAPKPVLPAAPEPKHRDIERSDALSRYFSQLREHAPISREEEHELAVRWVEQGDAQAARRLVLANLRLVVKIAMEYRRTWTNVLDLIQEGNVGLLQAVQRFDPYQGVKLSSYAAYWIRAYVLKYLLDNIRLVRLGTTRAQRKLFFRLNKEKRELERLGIEVEPRLIAERLDVTEDDVIDMEQRLGHSDLSFDAPVREEEGSATLRRFPHRPTDRRREERRRPRAAPRLPREGPRRSPRRSTSAIAASSTNASSPKSRRRSRRWATNSASRANASASSKRAWLRVCASS